MKPIGRYIISRLIHITSVVIIAASFAAQADEFVIELKPAAAAAIKSHSTAAAVANNDADQRLATVSTDQAQSTEGYCNSLLETGLVESCSPNFQVEVSKSSNDQQLGSLWGLQRIAAGAGWDIQDGSDVVIADIDTGIDYTHPDLVANMWTNPGEIPGDGIDNDGNGYVDDVHGVNAAWGTGNPMDDNGHGTHTAGTIGAVGNNGVGVVGVAWHVKLMALKFLNANGGGTIADAIRAINYMVKMKTQYGINIVAANNSWGGGGFSQPLYDAIKRARDAGIVFVAAAGNEANNNDQNPTYPASYQIENVLSVGAIDRSDKSAYFSNFGTSVSIAAPGVGIISTVPGGGYASLSGTSMATPHVTGAIALLAGLTPTLSFGEIISRVKGSGTYLASLSGKVESARVLNVARLLNGTVEDDPSNSAPEPLVTRVTVFGSSSKQSPVEGSRFTVKVRGLGSGTVDLKAYFNSNGYCEESKAIELKNGRATIRGRLPYLTREFKRVGFEIGGTRSSAKLKIKSRKLRLKYSSAESSSACAAIFASLN